MYYTYIRNLIGPRYDLDPDYLEGKVQDGIISCSPSSCDIYFDEPLTEEKKSELDASIALARVESPLAVHKEDRNEKLEGVHRKTTENEDLGVPYNNYRFSITPSAKSNWLAVVMVKDTLSYPFSAPTGFGFIYSFQDANDVLGFFAASMSYLQYWEQSDEQLTIAINACTTLEQLNAIVDNRSYPPA